MMNFKALEELNEHLPTMNIRGKKYVMVKDRVAAFRSCCPGGTITTEIVHTDGVTVTMKATVTDDDGKVLSSAHAQEKYNSTAINKTSALENCETSAVGRALGLIGIGIDDSFASANEVETAQAQQAAGETWPGPNERISPYDATKLRAFLGDRLDEVLAKYGRHSINEITNVEYSQIVGGWK